MKIKFDNPGFKIVEMNPLDEMKNKAESLGGLVQAYEKRIVFSEKDWNNLSSGSKLVIIMLASKVNGWNIVKSVQENKKGVGGSYQKIEYKDVS